MNNYLVWPLLLAGILSACTTGQGAIPDVTTTSIAVSPRPPTDAPARPATPMPAYPADPTAFPPTLSTPHNAEPPIPPDLQLAYILEDELFLWNQGVSRSLVARPRLSTPLLSPDGQWIVFRQILDPLIRAEELWAIRSDGRDLRRILGPEDLPPLVQTDGRGVIGDIGWLPGSQRLLFNLSLVDERRDGAGPPPPHDLYSLELSGRITQLASPGLGGAFTPSPDGRYVAVATQSQIGVLDLEAGTRRTLLEFEFLRMGCECIHIPDLLWDSVSQYLLTAIPSPYVYYPDNFGGEPEQIWRLPLDGPAELVAEVAPTINRASAVSLAPDLRRYFYYDGRGCEEGDFGAVHIRDLDPLGRDRRLFCAKNPPAWTPDGQHFTYYRDGHWYLGHGDETPHQPLSFLDQATRNAINPSVITWISEDYFLLDVRTQEGSSLSLATVSGIVDQIYMAPPDVWPQFSFYYPD